MAVDYLRPFISHTMNMLDIKEEMQFSEESKGQKGTIHSGHFMVSRVHDANNDDDEEEAASPFRDVNKGFDFMNAAKKTSTTYNFGNAAIDESLTKLFECMTLAYSGTITSPRWKQFRGLHVSQKQRIRLNNLIWREWHMQYIYQKHPMVCQFAMPLSDDIHSKPEAVVLEGKYWKRRLDTVTAEYKKWRRYFKDQVQQSQHYMQGSGVGATSWEQDTSGLSEWELLERVKMVTFIPCLGSGGATPRSGFIQGQSSTDLALLQNDVMDMDFSNDLFSSLNSAPFPFPNPRELNQLGCSDLIQPGLIGLQPNLEEFMDIDSMQELFNSKIPNSFGPTYTTSMGPSYMADTQTNVDISQENEMFLNFLNVGTAAPGSGGTTGQVTPGQMSSSVGVQQQTMSPLTQLMSAGGEGNMQTLPGFQLSTSADNHNGNGGQQPAPFQLEPNSTILLGTAPGGTTQAYTLVTTGGININSISNANMAAQLSSLPVQKVEPNCNTGVSGGGGGTLSTSDVLAQMLQQEMQKQRQRQQQQKQRQQQQQQQRLLQQQQRLQQQQQRAKAPPLAPKTPTQQQPIQQQLLQQILQQQQQQQQQQHHNKQQSPSSQSPLLAQSLTASLSSLFPQQHTVSNVTSPLRTNSQPVSVLPSPSANAAPSPQRKGGRQSRGGNHKQLAMAAARRDRGGGGGGASAAMSDLAKVAAGKKKDGPFTVPQAKSVNVPRKNRTIAPAPVPITPYVAPTHTQQSLAASPLSPSSSSLQESYLAKLLKNGTYTGAMINMKKDSPCHHSQPPGGAIATPIQTTTNLYQQLRAAQMSPPSAAGVSIQVQPQPTPDLVPGTGNQIQASLPMFAGTSILDSNLSPITTQTLGNVVLPVALGSHQLDTSASHGIGEQQQPEAAGFTQLLEEKAPSVPSSPKAPSATSTLAFSLKPSPSPPAPAMDTTSSSLGDPTSPFSMVDMSPSAMSDPNSPASVDYDLNPDNRRAAHLSAEQKRRWNLKTGFDMLQSLVPSLSQNPKVSKATMLQKTAEYCKKLKAERLQMQKEAAVLKREIETLNAAISSVQAQLPETGVPVTRQRKDQMKEMLDDYVRRRTKENWKFWIFSVIMNSLYDSYCSSVSTASMEELCRTSLTWLDQSCSLVTLRPNVLNALRKLSTTTSILTEPQRVKEQALLAVVKQPEKRK